MRFSRAIIFVLACGCVAAEPATRPTGDEMIDWLAGQATTSPATAPATQPATSPFTSRQNPDARRGTITLSSGERITGEISTTPEKPLRLWDEAAKMYRDLPLAGVASMKAEIVWERDEAEWHFIESGSDVKEFTGKTYPARETRYAVTMQDGRAFVGGIVAPIYVTTDAGSWNFVLHKRDKGEPGQKLAELIYIAKIEMD